MTTEQEAQERRPLRPDQEQDATPQWELGKRNSHATHHHIKNGKQLMKSSRNPGAYWGRRCGTLKQLVLRGGTLCQKMKTQKRGTKLKVY